MINKEFSKMAEQFRELLGPDGFSSQKFKEKPVFFARCDIVSCLDFYKEGGFQSFPVLLHLKPSKTDVPDVDFRQIDKINEIFQDPTAENMVSHVSRLTGHSFVRVVPVYRRIMTYGGIIILAILVLKLMYEKFHLHSKNPTVWFAVSVAVFAGVMAGTIFNAIHNPGLYHVNPQNQQLMLIYPSSRHQFVLEGVIMSALFTIGGLFFVGFNSHVPTFKDPWKQRGMFAVCALGCYTCWYWTMTIFKVKHPYYPYWK